MATRNNRQRILISSIDLFNGAGTVAVTTNHIAKHLKISPGNLYFHFDSKEKIVSELFHSMCLELYEAWSPKLKSAPDVFLDRSFEVFWKYRFFHREMYHLRRRDPTLSKAWKNHLQRCRRLLVVHYAQWLDSGAMCPLKDRSHMKVLADSVLLSSNAFLGFFESPEKPASRRTLRAAGDHVMRLLWPYFTDSYRRSLHEARNGFEQ